MTHFSTRHFLTLCFFIISASFQHLNATHIVGSDISYRCLGGNQYQIVVAVYRDCSGVAVPTSITVDVNSTCGTSTVTCAQDPATSSIEVSQLCPTAVSTCQGGSLPGVQVYTYLGTVTVQPNCGLYTFSYDDCCRNTVTNLADPAPPSLGFRVEATLNSNLVSCNDAPAFTSLPVPYFCANQPVNYSHGAIDTDGDSLVYTLASPLDQGGLGLAYNAPFSPTNPLVTSGGFGFDPQTGQMTFTPTQQGAYVVDVLVSEYRNGVLIGTTMRDIQIIIINCSNNAPTVNNCLSLSNVTGAVVTDCNSLGVCPGQTVSFTISGYDADAQAVTVTSNIATSIPGATLTTTQVGGPDSVVVVFSWTPSGIDTGFRYFTVQFEDDACPITGLQLFTYDITVLDGIDAGPDKYYCPGGGPVQVNVYGGNHFSWSQTTGMVSANPDSSVVLFAPTTNTTYYVTSDLLGGCKNRDTVTVFNVTPFGISFTSPDDTICLNSSTTITVNPTPVNQGPFTYQWGPANLGVLDPTSQTTEVRPGNTTQYQVTVTSAAGCAIKDSFQVVIQGIGPKVSVYPSANYVCPGSPVNLTATVSALECGLNPDPLNPCLPNSTFALQDIGTSTTNAGANTTPYIGLWDDGRVQYLFRASELQAMGLTAGTITDIGFNVATKASTQPYNEFTIKMGCSSLSQLPASYVTAGLSTVVNPQSYSSVAGWNTHTLDAPYNWDGFSNLIIEVCFNNSSYSGYDNVYFTTTSFPGSVLFDNADLTTQSGCTALNTPTLGQDRPNTRFIMCKAPLNNYSFTWTGSDGSTLPDTSEVTVPVFHNVDYTLVVDDGTCQGDSTISLFVDTAVLISAGNDTTICSSTGAQLNAVVLNPATTYCTPTYVLTSIPYSVIAPVGATTAGPAGDDAVSSGISIPFGFEFFCTSKTQMFISTNGFLSFSTGQGSGCCAGQAIPNATSANDLVALCWEDLNTNSGGNIDYFVSGTAPNRVMVVRWNNVAFYSVGGFVNGQIQLYETSNIIEIHINGATTAGQTNTLGIENSTGTVAYSPVGYNAAAWTVNSGAPVAFRFTPQFAGNSLTGVQWTPSLGLSNDTILNPVANPSSNTTYVVDATFFNGCVTHDTITVSLGTFPYTLSATPDTICPGDSSQLLFTGNGVTYNWTPTQFLSSNSVNNPIATPISTTTFYVSATNATGCAINDSVIVNVRTHSPITLGNDQTICPYDSVLLSPSGAPYVSYNWSTTAVTPTITTANQTATSQDYYVIVSDGVCLFSSDTVTITERVLNPIVVQPSGDTAVCVGESIVLSADPGYSNYIWSNGANTQVVTITQAGQYSYTATDNNGCILQSLDTANVIAAQHPVAEILVSDDNICEDQTSAVLSVSPVTGIVYTWNPGFIISDSLVVSNAGTYTLVASDNGCNSFDTVVISSTQAPLVDLGADQNICACDTQVVLSTTISGTYIWSNSATTPSISVSSTGTYSLTVTDSNNCTANDIVDVTIRCLTVDAFVADPPTATVFQGNNATLGSTTSYSSNFGYLWTPATYLDDSTKNQPYVQSPQTTTTYQVFVTDLVNGCTASDTVRLAVVPPGVPPMPNAFSPNGDGSNDVYGPYIPSALQGVYSIVNMRIYNRWGQLVYNNNGYWDGTFAGSLQPADTYIYYITIQGPDQNNAGAIVQYNLTGSFTLLH